MEPENMHVSGFVDFIDDAEVVDALFGAVEKWAVGQGMEALQGRWDLPIWITKEC